MPFHVPANNTTLRGLGILALIALWAGWRIVSHVVEGYKGAAG